MLFLNFRSLFYIFTEKFNLEIIIIKTILQNKHFFILFSNIHVYICVARDG